MATLDFTYDFPADTQGLVDQNVFHFGGGDIAFSWTGADGNPAGCVKFVTSGYAFQTYAEEEHAKDSTLTWEDWGVPSGATVTGVELVQFDDKYTDTTASGVISLSRLTVQVLDSSDVTVTSFTPVAIQGDAGAGWQTHTPAQSLSVSAPNGPSNTAIRFRLVWDFFSSGNAVPLLDARFDNILLRITYSPPNDLASIDICCTHPGKHIAFRSDTDIIVSSSFDEGTTWTPFLVTTDADPASSPTIAADHRDNLYCAWHTSGGDTEISLSHDYGRTWALWRTVSGAKWPRTSFNGRHAHLAFWAAGSIDIYRSLDSLVTLTLVASFAVSDEQLCDLGASKDGPGGDRRGMHRVIYFDSGNIKQRLSTDGIVWGSAVTLTAGELPVFVHYEPFGIVLWWVGDVPYIQAVSQDYVTGIGSPAAVTTGIPRQYLGLTVDRRDRPWLVYVFFPPTFPTDPPVVFWGPQLGTSPPEGQFDFGPNLPQYGFEETPPTGQFDALP